MAGDRGDQVKIVKVFNQNAVMVRDEEGEKIVTGKGIGFNKSKNDVIHPKDIEREFVNKKEVERMNQLFAQIDPQHFLSSEEIIDQAEKMLGTKLNSHIHILLADHIAFAIERMNDGMLVRNKLLNEIQILYPEEFRVAEWAVQFLRDRYQIDFPIDEAGYITMHLHSAILGPRSEKDSIKKVTIIAEMVALIAKELEVDFKELGMQLNYSRLVTHLRFTIERIYQDKYYSLDDEVFSLLKEKYPESYGLAKKMQHMVIRDFHLTIPDEELGYITLHIERLRSQLH